MTKIAAEAERLWDSFPVKYFEGLRNVGSSGDYIYNTKKRQAMFYCARDGER